MSADPTLVDAFFTRTWWTADVRRDESGAVALLPRPGCRRVVLWRQSLNTFVDQLEPQHVLHAAVGDRFVACGPTIDETLLVTVVSLTAEGALRVELSTEIPTTTITLQLLPIAKTPKKRT